MVLIDPLQLIVTTEDGMTASQYQTQYDNAFHGQRAIDDYFRGIGTEDDLIAKLEYYGIDWKELEDILEFNMVMRYGIQA